MSFLLYKTGLARRGLAKDKRLVFLIIWLIFIFLFFSISKSKLVWYIIPIYPVAAIIVGTFIEKTLQFVTRKIVFLQGRLAKVLILYTLVFFSLTYLFINKELIYTSDLTGAESEAVVAKDRIFGTAKVVLVDKIELPVILFYTDGPFRQLQFADLQKILNDQGYSSDIIFITKESRFAKFKSTIPKLILEFQDKEWVLGYAPSQLSLDEEALQEHVKKINELNYFIFRSTADKVPVPLETVSMLRDLKAAAGVLTQRINSASNN